MPQAGHGFLPCCTSQRHWEHRGLPGAAGFSQAMQKGWRIISRIRSSTDSLLSLDNLASRRWRAASALFICDLLELGNDAMYYRDLMHGGAVAPLAVDPSVLIAQSLQQGEENPAF